LPSPPDTPPDQRLSHRPCRHLKQQRNLGQRLLSIDIESNDLALLRFGEDGLRSNRDPSLDQVLTH
jgi:hypothetical protein